MSLPGRQLPDSPLRPEPAQRASAHLLFWALHSARMSCSSSSSSIDGGVSLDNRFSSVECDANEKRQSIAKEWAGGFGVRRRRNDKAFRKSFLLQRSRSDYRGCFASQAIKAAEESRVRHLDRGLSLFMVV